MKFPIRSAALAIGLWCSLAGASAQAEEKKPVRVGVMLAVSGPAAFLGVSERNALDMTVEKINGAGGIAGRRIETVFYDTEGNGTKAGQLFRRLAESDGVDVVVGPSTTGESMVVVPIANELKVPVVTLAGAASVVNPVTPYVFKTPPTDQIVAHHLLSYMKQKGYRKIALINSADGFGQAGAAVVKEFAKEAGVEVAAAEEFGPRDSDMTPQLLRIRKAEADALLIWSVNPGPTIILRNARTLGFDKPIFNSYGAASPKLIEQAGPAADGTYISSMRLLAPESLAADDPLRAVVTDLAQSYAAKFKEPPTTFAAHTHDAILAIEGAVKSLGDAPVTRDGIAKALENVSFYGGNGAFHYTPTNHNGLDESSHSMVMLKIEHGRFVIAE